MPSDLFTASPDSGAFAFDPWNVPDDAQYQRRKAFCQIWVNYYNVTDKLSPHLISVRIIDGGELRCEIELDDRDGSLPIPPPQSSCLVYLGWTTESVIKVFDGHIADIESGMNRDGGRRMWVHAHGMTQNGQIKEPMSSSQGEGAPPGQATGTMVPFSQFVNFVTGAAGATSSIHPALAAMSRDHWAQTNESAMQAIARHAEALGGYMRVEGGNNFVITLLGSNADGSPKPTIIAQWGPGKNLIGWRVHPVSSRTVWNGANQQWFNTIGGAWNKYFQAFGLPNAWSALAKFGLPVPAANSGQATQEAAGAGSPGYYGEGRIILNGEPTAQKGAFCNIVGARPGVDGTYWITEAEHIYSRQGYLTWLDVIPFSQAVAQGNVSTGYTGPQGNNTAPAPTPSDDSIDNR